MTILTIGISECGGGGSTPLVSGGSCLDEPESSLNQLPMAESESEPSSDDSGTGTEGEACFVQFCVLCTVLALWTKIGAMSFSTPPSFEYPLFVHFGKENAVQP